MQSKSLCLLNTSQLKLHPLSLLAPLILSSISTFSINNLQSPAVSRLFPGFPPHPNLFYLKLFHAFKPFLHSIPPRIPPSHGPSSAAAEFFQFYMPGCCCVLIPHLSLCSLSSTAISQEPPESLYREALHLNEITTSVYTQVFHGGFKKTGYWLHLKINEKV